MRTSTFRRTAVLAVLIPLLVALCACSAFASTTAAAPAADPSIGAPSASGVTPTSELVQATWLNWLQDSATMPDTTAFVEYGPTDSYSSVSPVFEGAQAAQTVSFTLSGLDANSSYHYALVLVSSDGTTVTPDSTFTTDAAAEVQVAPTSPDQLTASQLSGSSERLFFSAESNDSPGSCAVLYGTSSTNLNAQAACVSLDAGGDLSQESPILTGLQAATTYYYAVAVTNIFGTTTSETRSFTTGPAAEADLESAASNSPELAGGVTLTGNVSTNGDGATSYYFEVAPWSSGPFTLAGLTTTDSAPQMVTGAAGEQAVTGTVDGLTPGACYSYALVATNAAGTVTSPTASEACAGRKGEVDGLSVSPITNTTATVSGSLDAFGQGGDQAFVDYSPQNSNKADLTTPDQTVATSDGTSLTAALKGLQPGTTYRATGVLITPWGDVWGPTEVFTTTGTASGSSAPPSSGTTAGVSVGQPTITSTVATVPVSCTGTSACNMLVTVGYRQQHGRFKTAASATATVARAKHRNVRVSLKHVKTPKGAKLSVVTAIKRGKKFVTVAAA
jgi:hypothetical protein